MAVLARCRPLPEAEMKLPLLLVGWLILLAVTWPLALLFLLSVPPAWLPWSPSCLAGAVSSAFHALVESPLFLPARILGYRGQPARRADHAAQCVVRHGPRPAGPRPRR
jgi:hypothetical protein